MSKSIYKNDHNQKLYNQFFLFGAFKDDINIQTPLLLSMFPSDNLFHNDNEIQEIMKFCFPNSFSEILDSNQSEDKDASKFSEFSFIHVNSNGEKEYGICVQFTNIQSSQSPLYNTNASLKYPFAICILSSYPFLISHFQFLLYIMLILLGKGEKMLIDDANSIPNEEAFWHPDLVFSHPQNQSPNDTKREIDFYLNLYNNLDKIDNSITNKLFCKEIPFYHPFPNTLSRKQWKSFPTLDVLFSFLEIDMILDLYTALLLERRILFISKDPHKYSLAVIGLSTLAKPFKLAKTQIFPVIKHNCYVYDQFPYLAGAPFLNQSTADVVCDLDECSLTVKASFSSLPNVKELKQKIEMILKDRENEITVPQMHIKHLFSETENPEYANFFKNVETTSFPPFYTSKHNQKYIFKGSIVDAIRECFASHFAYNVYNAIAKSIVDGKDEINIDTLMEEMDTEKNPFYKSFVITHIFHEFTERVKKDLKNEHVGTLNSYSPTIALSPFHLQ